MDPISKILKIFKVFVGFCRLFIGSYTINPDRPYLAPLLALVFFMGFCRFLMGIKGFDGGLWGLKGFMGFESCYRFL